MDYSPPGSVAHTVFQAKILEASCHFLLQRIFLTLRSPLGLLHLLYWQADFFTTGATWEAQAPMYRRAPKPTHYSWRETCVLQLRADAAKNRRFLKKFFLKRKEKKC